MGMEGDLNFDQLHADHFEARGIDQYAVDGAMNSEKWHSAPLRIAFLLKENYGYQGCDVIWTADEAHGWIDKGIPTYIKLLTLSAAIFSGMREKRMLSDEEVLEISKDRELLHETLEYVATINIKKHSGLSESNDGEIRDESRKNAALLTEQIKRLEPQLVIAGGEVCWHSLRDDQSHFSEPVDCPKHGVIEVGGTFWCRTYHPGSYGRYQFPIHALHKEVLSKLGMR